jgi:hypothetical protein
MFGYLLVDFFDKRPVALLATDDVTLFKSTALAFPRAVARPRKFWRSYDVKTGRIWDRSTQIPAPILRQGATALALLHIYNLHHNK